MFKFHSFFYHIPNLLIPSTLLSILLQTFLSQLTSVALLKAVTHCPQFMHAVSDAACTWHTGSGCCIDSCLELSSQQQVAFENYSIVRSIHLPETCRRFNAIVSQLKMHYFSGGAFESLISSQLLKKEKYIWSY